MLSENFSDNVLATKIFWRATWLHAKSLRNLDEVGRDTRWNSSATAVPGVGTPTWGWEPWVRPRGPQGRGSGPPEPTLQTPKKWGSWGGVWEGLPEGLPEPHFLTPPEQGFRGSKNGAKVITRGGEARAPSLVLGVHLHFNQSLIRRTEPQK